MRSRNENFIFNWPLLSMRTTPPCTDPLDVHNLQKVSTRLEFIIESKVGNNAAPFYHQQMKRVIKEKDEIKMKSTRSHDPNDS